jgi:hypothetical protein
VSSTSSPLISVDDMISKRGSKYFFTCINAASNFVFVRFMARKNQVLDKSHRVRFLVENPTIPWMVKISKSDNEKEYNPKDWSYSCLETAIDH